MNPENNITHIFWSLTQLNMAIRELETLYKHRTNELELELLNHQMFKIFHLALKNLVIIEYCKLLEISNLVDGNGNDVVEHMASIFKFYKLTMRDKVGANVSLSSNLKKLKKIVKTPFYIMMKDLRNKKHAHSDNHIISTPYHVPSFSDDDMKILNEHFILLNSLFHACADEYEKVHYDTESYQSEIEYYVNRYAKHSEFYYQKSGMLI
ncbi:hypothetical protein AAKU52_003533 [Pedobacter sp. CG_S7]|uniref:hypothetical protein n=1 Tax=Pedobacter sp. CG_S7 TaxID=3143930 RepID=UPI00339A1D42